MNTDYKSIFSSTTFWGSVVALLATLVPAAFTLVGLTTDASGQATLVAHILSYVGFAMAVYGRMTATQPVSLLGKALVAPPVPPVAPKV